MRMRFIYLAGLALALAGCQSTQGPFALWGVPPAGVPSALPTNDPAVMGRDEFEHGDYALAERSYQKAVERNKSDYASWVGLAASYDELGYFKLADRAYEAAAVITGPTFELLNDRGYSYLLRGDRRNAKIMLERAHALRPHDAVVNNNLVLLSLSV